MALKSDEIIDATVKGNIGRFTNHSCEPNCETQKVSGKGCLVDTTPNIFFSSLLSGL
jgi:histone-lysine N-methyltransferase SETD2